MTYKQKLAGVLILGGLGIVISFIVFPYLAYLFACGSVGWFGQSIYQNLTNGK